jgi:hypothetical protein
LSVAVEVATVDDLFPSVDKVKIQPGVPQLVSKGEMFWLMRAPVLSVFTLVLPKKNPHISL